MQLSGDNSTISVKVFISTVECFQCTTTNRFLSSPFHQDRLVKDTIPLSQVVLGRRLLGVFMTIYMPTILMNVVGHCTMYFKPFFFEAQV